MCIISVVGRVGSGKSSLLSGLLGEMHKLAATSKLNVNGSTAYVPQQAWIKNDTIQSNILFTTEMNESFYAEIIDACALKTDFDVMIAGDQTEIGEKVSL